MSNISSGKWKQLRGRVKEKWGRLTDDDITEIAGQKDRLVGKLQERYGKEASQFDREVDQFYSKV